MQLNQAALARMLAMDDAGLRALIAQLAAGAGMSPGQVKVSDADLAALRRALSGSSPEELTRLAADLQRRGGSGHGQ